MFKLKPRTGPACVLFLAVPVRRGPVKNNTTKKGG